MEEYISRIKTQVSFGKFVWCGNMNIPHGFVLSDQNINDIYGDPNTFMLHVEINMNRALLYETEYIELYTLTGFLFSYNTNKISLSLYEVFKKIKQDDIGKEIKVLFRKPKVLTEDEEKELGRTLKRIPMETIFEQSFIIPDILSYYTENECNICLSDVDEINNAYIGP